MIITTYILPKGALTATKNNINSANYESLKGMFTTPLSSSGNNPATHYISSGVLSQEEIDFLDANIPPAFVKRQGDDPHAMMAEQNLKVVQDEILTV